SAGRRWEGRGRRQAGRRGEGEAPPSDPRLAQGRRGRLEQAPGLRPAPGSTDDREGAAPLAEGQRPGRSSRRDGAGQTPGGRTEGVHPTMGRGGGVAEEGRGEAEIATVSRRAAEYSPRWLAPLPFLLAPAARLQRAGFSHTLSSEVTADVLLRHLVRRVLEDL